MMSQIMLLGIGSANNSNMSDTQRQEVINNIKMIIEKPVKIKQETVHVNYSISKVEPQTEMSLHEELQSTTSKRVGTQKKMTYLEEFEQKEKQNDKLKSKVVDSIEEDIAIRSNDFSSSKQ